VHGFFFFFFYFCFCSKTVFGKVSHRFFFFFFFFSGGDGIFFFLGKKSLEDAMFLSEKYKKQLRFSKIVARG